MKLETTDLKPRIGTEIKARPEDLLSGAHTQQIRDLLEQRGVLVFRQINLDDDQQLAFSKTLGEIIPQGEKGIYKITLDQNVNPTADYLHGTFYWHIDGTYDDVPTRASLLTARKLSKTGGQTQFANTYAAYDDLPEKEKMALEKLRVVHSQEIIQRKAHPGVTDAEMERFRYYAPKSQPLVWTHQSGRKSLVLGLTAVSVEGMDEEEGRALLDRLQEWSTQPQFVYAHDWTAGDLIIWDNTGVMHRVTRYAADSDRLMHRTTLVGEEPLV